MYFDIFGLFCFQNITSWFTLLVNLYGQVWSLQCFTTTFRVHHPKVTLYPLSYGKSLYDFVSSGFT